MRIVDAHVHFSRIGVFSDTARLYSGVDYSAEGLKNECAANGVEYAVGMGVTETERYGFPDYAAATPMRNDIENPPPFLHNCPGINPFTLDEAALARLDEQLNDKRCVGIKIYAGYYPFHVYDDIYAPAYRLAARYGKAVCIHTGDTYSERGLLEYSHPLKIDRLAGMYRDVNFVLAHMGDPWIIDACELAYKNANVYLDASGLVVGEEKEISRVRDEPLLRDRFRQGILFLNDYDKLLFGTDWPLAAMKPYIGFCKTLVPEPFHDKFFYENAVRVYRIGGCCV